MSEYKENTVGWWLSQLKEPLRSKVAKEFSKFHNSAVSESTASPSMALAISSFGWSQTEDLDNFWIGVKDFFLDYRKRDNSQEYISGYNMAKECAPDNWLKPKDGGEDKAVVDSPKKTMELFFYADETLINPLCNPFKEPLVIYPRGEMNSVIVEEDKIKELMNANPSVTFWPTNVGGVSPAPEIPVTGAMIEDFGKRVKWPITREIEAPERAVVGYEGPKPIDTIEKKHELRIKNLEARVKQLEDQLFKYLGSKNG